MAQTTTPYLITSTIRIGPLEYRKGAVAHLTATQVTAVGATNLRTVNNPSNVNGSHCSSETHDTAGEASAVSNSS